MNKNYTLRKKIEETKADYLKRYGKLNWQYADEGLPWAIQDYHSSVGSVMDFSADDWAACKESGWELDEVCSLCDEPWFSGEPVSKDWFLTLRLEEWRRQNDGDETAELYVPQEVIPGFESEFKTWYEKLLPAARAAMAGVKEE